jgi:sugar phosphate isomerase/epimerase
MRASGSAVAVATLGNLAMPNRGSTQSPSFEFKLGIQSYSLRHYPFAEALEWTQKLGLRYWESYSAHIPTKAEDAAKHQEQAKARGVSVIGYGVVHFSKNHEANRSLFEFGKALGVSYFSADPDLDAFDSLDKLVDEYQIAVGIHNHGPGHKWEKIGTIYDAVKNHHKFIGCCVDTGHFLRSKEDPVEAVERFSGRVYGVHLKDVKNATQFTVLGQGDLRTAELLKSLAAQGYKYCLALEYEENEANPIDDIKSCLKAVEAAMPKG